MERVVGTLVLGEGLSESRLRAVLTEYLSGLKGAPAVRAKNNFADAGVAWNRFFTGRVADLARLYAALSAQSPGTAHAIIGGPGVGKTELARAFAFTFSGEYDGAWWIDASEAGFSESISRVFAVATGEPPAPGRPPGDLARDLGQRWSAGKHLVVLDNLDSSERLSDFAVSGQCRLLATTRLDLTTAATVEPFHIDVIGLDGAVELLRKQTARRSPGIAEGDLRAIADELGSHTLAVALAGAYLARYADTRASEYLQRLRESGAGEAVPREEGRRHDPLALRYEHSVRASLSLHFPMFESTGELAFLQLASFCHSSGIPVDLLASAAGIELTAARRWARHLADVSIITYEGSLGIHRLTQSVVRSMLAPAQRDEKIDSLVNVMLPAYANPRDQAAWPRQRAYAAHAGAVTTYAEAGRATITATSLANGLGASLLFAGRYADARRSLELALRIGRSILGVDDPNIAGIHANLAEALRQLGELSEAAVQIKQAMDIQKKHQPQMSLHLAASAYTQGNVLKDIGDERLRQGKPDAAREAYQAAKVSHQCSVALKEVCGFSNDPSVARSYSALAIVHKQLGELDEAERCMRRALQIDTSQPKLDGTALASRYSNLATIQQDQRKFDAARKSVQQAIDIELKILPEDHPNVGIRYHNLAGICHDAGDAEGARRNWLESLRILRKTFDDSHPSVQTALMSMRTCGYSE
ncbi:MAG: tetratricopeptide repeat protein [Phycisphaerales bacterium]